MDGVRRKWGREGRGGTYVDEAGALVPHLQLVGGAEWRAVFHGCLMRPFIPFDERKVGGEGADIAVENRVDFLAERSVSRKGKGDGNREKGV